MSICNFRFIQKWQCNFSLEEPGEYVPIDNQDETTFDVSAVNIEENGNRNPIKYMLPPGIEQELDNTTTSQDSRMSNL